MSLEPAKAAPPTPSGATPAQVANQDPKPKEPAPQAPLGGPVAGLAKEGPRTPAPQAPLDRPAGATGVAPEGVDHKGPAPQAPSS